jgi:predicted dienelactone hydrolase
MKWIRRVVAAVAILACVLAGVAFVTALRTERPVGFEITRATGADGRAFTIGVWYPTQARPWPTTLVGVALMDVARDAPISGRDLPLVVISHGNGGGIPSHADLALALASAGHVVAAPVHAGDNYADQSAVGSASFFTGRTRQLHDAVDYMLGNWRGHDRIDPERIGAFGFSAGGFTVLTAIGARPDLRLVATHCAEAPEFACDVLRYARSALLNAGAPGVDDAFVPDSRIKAAVVAAPGLGFTMGPSGLAAVSVPVQLWSGDSDDKVPYATNARPVREALGSRVEFHPVPGAGHLSFLTPCGVLAPSDFCADPSPFDRKAFHRDMNARVVAFFAEKMKRR